MILAALPTPSKTPSDAQAASLPYLAPIILVAPLLMPEPIQQTALTTPSQMLANTVTPVLAPSFTGSQYLFYCSYLPFSLFQNRSPTSDATCFPKWNRFFTCSDVNQKTLLLVLEASFIFSFVLYLISTFFQEGYTFLEIRPPSLSNPLESSPPVNANPLPICLDAPTNTDFALILELLLQGTLSNIYYFAFQTGFWYYQCFSLFQFVNSALLFLRQHFQLRHEYTESEFSLILSIHCPQVYFFNIKTRLN